MANTAEEPLWKYDLPHLGALCKLIRERRSVHAVDIAHLCGVSDTTISRNLETEGRLINKDTFECYVAHLQSTKLNPHPPLTPKQAQFLLDHYEHYKHLKDWQYEVDAIDLKTITPNYRSKLDKPKNDKEITLDDLVTELTKIDKPALIMDSLWFVHALNQGLLSLYGFDPSNFNYLYNWEAWHTIATKFNADSPVRKAYPNFDKTFPSDVVNFFEDKDTSPFLFTNQMRILIKRLHELSEQHNFLFTKWWDLATSFYLDYPIFRTFPIE